MAGGLIGKAAKLVKGKKASTKSKNLKKRAAKKRLSKETAEEQRDRLEAGMTMSKKEKADYLRKRRPRGKKRKAALERHRKLDDPNLPF